MTPLIITCAVVGAELSRDHTPHLPLTSQEIADECVRAAEAGAAMVHIHARDPQTGAATQAAEVYAEIVARVRARSDVIIQISSGGAVGMTAAERLAPVLDERVAPEMASLTTGTVNFGDDVFWNAPQLIREFAQAMTARGIKPEIEAFEIGHVSNALRLVEEGFLCLPLHFDFVLGMAGGLPGEVRHLVQCVAEVPPGSTWSVAGVGRAQLPLNTAAIVMGGHVRTGLEDNIYYSRGVLTQGNAPLVARLARIAAEVGRPVAPPAQARELLGLRLR